MCVMCGVGADGIAEREDTGLGEEVGAGVSGGGECLSIMDDVIGCVGLEPWFGLYER